MFFTKLPLNIKKKLIKIWKSMSETDKRHFTNQLALFFTILGVDDNSKQLALDIISKLVMDGSKNLSDFGLYLSQSNPSLKRAKLIIDDYRFRHNLSFEPSKEF